VLAIGGYLAYRIVTDELYTSIFTIVGKGAGVTAFVTIVAFLLASTIGLLLALASLSNVLLLRQIARFYVEVVRGIPILVLCYFLERYINTVRIRTCKSAGRIITMARYYRPDHRLFCIYS